MKRSPMTTAILLGIAGLIPFIATLAIIVLRPHDAPAATQTMIAYGACILSFLGAVHWGFALAPGNTTPLALNLQRLSFGVLPSLVAWGALLVLILGQAPRIALLILIAGFFATVLGETIGRGKEIVAANYLTMRWGISIVVMAILLAVLVLDLMGARGG